MNKLTKSTGIILLMIVLSAFVVFAWVKYSSWEVKTCTDSDGGLNKTIQGTAYGLLLDNQNYSFTDYCTQNNTVLVEFACSYNNPVYNNSNTSLEMWFEPCTCSNGRCI
ncbi:hypothetical protein J4466_01200 [Candidatus Pacearchaeota archaeon]|nr:hypothetical protein [Candidatus Pacearchaeota archaeon]